MTTETKTKKAVKKTKSPTTAEIRVRVDVETKSRAEKFFKRHGLTTGAGIRMLLEQALEDRDELHVPNAETRAAIEECRAGRGEIVPLSQLEDRILGKT